MSDPLTALRRLVYDGLFLLVEVGFGAAACGFVAMLLGMGFSGNLEVRSAIE
jgi:hypothetical protein